MGFRLQATAYHLRAMNREWKNAASCRRRSVWPSFLSYTYDAPVNRESGPAKYR
ncbi:hypothetical protein HAX54_012731, partial [Datura stramonium]|nr:hypothetical protein [Datura stramonium]